MPAYVATHSLRYGADSSSMPVNWLNGTATDSNNDVWTDGEALSTTSGTLWFGSGSYAGQITVNGNQYPVTVDGLDGNYVVLFDNADDRDDAAAAFSTTGTLLAATSTADFTACFLEGTTIATPQGDRLVQDLQIGDMVLNHDGQPVAVKWLGVQQVLTAFQPAERLMPVRFAAGSLGHGLPVADLTVTADHAMLVDGVLCQASALVNGSTITRVPLDEVGPRYTVYHVETEAHEIILANGAPAETFIDNISRRSFDNFAEYEALYGAEREMAELPLPRALSPRQLPASTRAKLGLTQAA